MSRHDPTSNLREYYPGSFGQELIADVARCMKDNQQKIKSEPAKLLVRMLTGIEISNQVQAAIDNEKLLEFFNQTEEADASLYFLATTRDINDTISKMKSALTLQTSADFDQSSLHSLQIKCGHKVARGCPAILDVYAAIQAILHHGEKAEKTALDQFRPSVLMPALIKEYSQLANMGQLMDANRQCFEKYTKEAQEGFQSSLTKLNVTMVAQQEEFNTTVARMNTTIANMDQSRAVGKPSAQYTEILQERIPAARLTCVKAISKNLTVPKEADQDHQLLELLKKLLTPTSEHGEENERAILPEWLESYQGSGSEACRETLTTNGALLEVFRIEEAHQEVYFQSIAKCFRIGDLLPKNQALKKHFNGLRPSKKSTLASLQEAGNGAQGAGAAATSGDTEISAVTSGNPHVSQSSAALMPSPTTDATATATRIGPDNQPPTSNA